MPTGTKIPLSEARELLDRGRLLYEVAAVLGVTPQSLSRAIHRVPYKIPRSRCTACRERPRADKSVLCRECRQKHYLDNREQILKRTDNNRHRRQEQNRSFVDSYLQTHPCVDCGETDSVVLQFDHVHGEKDLGISQAIWSWELGRLQGEIAKCEVRCANCHIRRHFSSKTGQYARR